MQSVKFSYGNNATAGTEKIKILLPQTIKGEPDFAFMEVFNKQKEHEINLKYQNYISKKIRLINDFKDVKPLAEKDWGEFFLHEIFTNIQRGKRLKKGDHLKGNIPYVSSTAFNNGVDTFVGNKEKVRKYSNCLTLANSGSVGACFYQPYEFVASDHVTKLENENLNEFNYFFISFMVSRLAEKYSFNREINDKRIKREKILLPLNDKQEPDFEYMENYMKRLEYLKLKLYMEKKLKRNLKKNSSFKLPSAILFHSNYFYISKNQY